jgi:outer membrane protein assembly factor BamB
MHKLWLTCWGLLLLLGYAPAAELAGDPLDHWHHWRGPLATGFAPRGEPPLSWDDKTNIQWKLELRGASSSTPVVWGNKVFVLMAYDTGRKAAPADIPMVDPKFTVKTQPPDTYFRFVVLCVDRRTGQPLWERVAAEAVPHEGHHPSHSYAAGSPMTDGHFLYVSFGSRGLYCYDLDGNLIWKRDLGLLHTRLGWGEAVTPVVHGDALIVNWDNEANSCVYVFDARTGKQRWKADRDERSSWGTPLVREYQGRTQVVMSATNKVRSYDLATGELIWQCGGQTVNAIPSPVGQGDVVYCMSGYTGSLACAIPLSAKGDVTDGPQVLWRHTRGTPYVPSPLLVDDRLYFTQQNANQLTCLDVKAGKPLIDRARLDALSSLYASPVAAQDRIYFTGRDGTTVVIKRSDKLEVLAVNRLDDTIDASPVMVGKQLLLRGHKYLYCIAAAK